MLHFIYFILLFIFPIILSIMLNLIIDNGNTSKLKEELKYIFDIIFKIIKIIAIVFFVDILLQKGGTNEKYIENMFLNVVYFSIFFTLIIFVNYFSTRYYKFKICIRTFLDELVKFIRDNFILNLLFFTLLVFVKNDAELTIGLIGSYFFFALTTIHTEYKKNIKKENKEFKLLYKLMQFLLNFCILLSFTGIEKILSQYSKGKLMIIDFKYTIFLLILSVMIVINIFLPQIEKMFKRLIR